MANAVNYVTSSLFMQLLAFQDVIQKMKSKAIDAFDEKLVKFDGWFLVLVAILMSLAFTIVAGMAIWCVVYKGKRFSGRWSWSVNGVSIWMECV